MIAMQMLIRCVLAAEHLPAFVDGMLNLAVGMTVWESREHGSDVGHRVSYRGVPYQVGTQSATIDLVSDESWVDDIIRRVREAHLKEEFTVRHLTVMRVEGSYHIRNGFMDV